MSGVYIVTGKLGNGKTLCCVAQIKDAIEKGNRVATNLDINLKSMFHRKAKNIQLIRIPDKPTIEDLNAIGKGYEGPYNEDRFGLLVLDECGTWFNARNWNDKTRKDVNDWFLHARKLGWIVFIIIQDISLLDSQAREALSEHTVFCRRLDRVRIPFISSALKTLTGFNVKLPRVHRAKVVYGTSKTDLVTDVWWVRGDHLFAAYDTRQSFIANYPHKTHSVLPPWHTHGRYSVTMNRENIMRLTKIYWRRFKSPVALAAGFLFGVSAMVMQWPRYQDSQPVQSVSVQHEAVEQFQPLFTDIYIVGIAKINGRIQYEFAQGDHTDTVYTSMDLANMGFKVEQQNECSALIAYLDKVQPVTCKLHL